MARKAGASKAAVKPTYKIVVDTREQNPWVFKEGEQCEKILSQALPTGDYSLEGFEDVFAIERKGCVAEVAQNVLQKRFENELARLSAMPFPFIVCEFTVEQLMQYPANTDIPWKKRRFIKLRGPFILKRLCEFMVKYGVPVIFAGEYGQEVALSLFKRVVEERENGKNKPARPVQTDG